MTVIVVAITGPAAGAIRASSRHGISDYGAFRAAEINPASEAPIQTDGMARRPPRPPTVAIP